MEQSKKTDGKTTLAFLCRNFVPAITEYELEPGSNESRSSGQGGFEDDAPEQMIHLPLRVGLPASLCTVVDIMDHHMHIDIVLVCQFADQDEAPSPENMARMGVLGQAQSVVERYLDHRYPIFDILFQGKSRVRVGALAEGDGGGYRAEIEFLPEPLAPIELISAGTREEIDSLFREILDHYQIPVPAQYDERSLDHRTYPDFPPTSASLCSRELVIGAVRRYRSVNAIADLIIPYLPIAAADKQSLFEELDPLRRIERVLGTMRRCREIPQKR